MTMRIFDAIFLTTMTACWIGVAVAAYALHSNWREFQGWASAHCEAVWHKSGRDDIASVTFGAWKCPDGKIYPRSES